MLRHIRSYEFFNFHGERRADGSGIGCHRRQTLAMSLAWKIRLGHSVRRNEVGRYLTLIRDLALTFLRALNRTRLRYIRERVPKHMRLGKKASLLLARRARACPSRSALPPLSPPPPLLRDFLGYLETRRLNLRSANSASRWLAGWLTRNPDSASAASISGRSATTAGTRTWNLRRGNGPAKSRWEREKRSTERCEQQRRGGGGGARRCGTAQHATAALARSRRWG